MVANTAHDLDINITEIDARLADNWSLPTRFYWDPAIFDFEMEAIFSKNWLYFGPVQKVAEPGDDVGSPDGSLPDRRDPRPQR